MATRLSHGDSFTLLASAARTSTTTGTAQEPFLESGQTPQSFVWVLDVTAAATDAGDTLDVQVQTQLGGGDEWVAIVSFAQVLGNGGAKTFVEKTDASLAEAGFETGAALAAGEVRNLHGRYFRAVGTIVDSGDADQSFTFSVTGQAM